jgi:hypothetical protein
VTRRRRRGSDRPESPERGPRRHGRLVLGQSGVGGGGGGRCRRCCQCGGGGGGRCRSCCQCGGGGGGRRRKCEIASISLPSSFWLLLPLSFSLSLPLSLNLLSSYPISCPIEIYYYRPGDACASELTLGQNERNPVHCVHLCADQPSALINHGLIRCGTHFSNFLWFIDHDGCEGNAGKLPMPDEILVTNTFRDVMH